MIKPISISLSPNVESDDLRLAFKLLLQPWRWRRGEGITKLESEFKKYFNVKHALSFNSGRSSLMAILNSLKGEVLIQAFTCNAAINPIIWSGLKPVYVDANDNFNIDIEDLKNKINSKTKAIIIQHTFGIPAEIEKIKKIAKENNLLLIEDCAHSLGAKYNNQKIGTFGDVAFFSFSRDKIISSVYGGMVITNNDELAKRVSNFKKEIKYPSLFWIKQQLLHPLLMSLILPIYGIIGKYFLVCLQSFHILSMAVHLKEKQGLKPSYFPKKMPNALALLALNQFAKLDKFNNHRREIAKFYLENLKDDFEFPKIPQNSEPVYLRLPVKHRDAHKIIKKLWKKNILIGNWYTTAIAPCNTIPEKLNYFGNCFKAEELAKITLNLPTHINIGKKEARKILTSLLDN